MNVQSRISFCLRKIVVLGGSIAGHVVEKAVDCEDVHGVKCFGSRNAESERILEFGEVMDMVVCNTSFRKRDGRLIAYESGGTKS